MSIHLARYLFLLLLAVSLAAVGCTSQKTVALSPELLADVKAAEAFVVRYGFTGKGHPANQPIERIEVFDSMSNGSDLAKRRENTIFTSAFAVDVMDGKVIVLFRSADPSQDCAYGVGVSGGVAIRLFHPCYLNTRSSIQILPGR